MKIVPTAMLSVCLSASAWLKAEPIQFIHSWQSPNEEKAFAVLEKNLKKNGLPLTSLVPEDKQLADNTSIKSFAKSFTDNPTFVALPKEQLRQWYDLRLLHSLSSIAKAQQWSEKIPPHIMQYVTHRDQIIAAPTSFHTTNWLWSNKALIDATGLEINDNWDSFIAVLTKLKEQNVTPFIHDGSQNHDMQIFESLFLSEFGAQKYTSLFVDLDDSALRIAKPDFETNFARLASLKPFITRLPTGSHWNDLAQKILSGEAAMTIQGDWILGEFARQGRIANQHYYCQSLPGQKNALAIRVDAIASLNSNAQGLTDVQTSFFEQAVNKDTQFLYNNYKGGLPAIRGTGLESLNECLAFANQRTETALAENSIVPSLSQGMAVREVIKREIAEVITTFMTTNQTPEDAAKQLQKRIKYASYLMN